LLHLVGWHALGENNRELRGWRHGLHVLARPPTEDRDDRGGGYDHRKPSAK
jgi:hypothetical protein